MVSISILLYGQLLQVIGYIETRTDIKYDEKEEVVNMCKAWDDHKKLGIQEGMKQGIQQGMQQGRCLEVYSLVQDGILDPEVGASRVSMSLDDFADAMQKAGYKLPEMVQYNSLKVQKLPQLICVGA